MAFTPRDPDLHSAFSTALEAAVHEAAAQLESGKLYFRKRDWPRFERYFDSGMPSFGFSFGLSDGPIDYTSLLTGYGSSAESYPWFHSFRDFCFSHSRVREFYSYSWIEQASTESHSFFSTSIAIMLGEYLDSYIHSRPLPPLFDQNAADTLYDGLETLLFSDKLPLTIVLPLVCFRCELDEFPFSDRVGIVKLTDDQQLSRMEALKNESSISRLQRIVLGAATHAIVLLGWSIQRPTTRWELFNTLGSRGAYDLSQADDLICALRLALPGPIGYGQIVVAPFHWPAQIRGNLPPWMSHTIRRYPTSFESGRWNSPDVPQLTTEVGERTKTLFAALSTSKSAAFKIARDRINFAALRESEEDAVIDATIALEALLAADSTQELTHKLALRVAALGKVAGYDKKPHRVFQEVKKIYAHRSALVHGLASADTKREIKIREERPIPTVVAAEEYAKLVMRTLLEHPEYADPETIDAQLLLGDTEG